MTQANKTPSSQLGLLEYAVVLSLIILVAILSMIFLNNNIQNVLPPLATPTAPAGPSLINPNSPAGFAAVFSVPVVLLLVSLKGQ